MERFVARTDGRDPLARWYVNDHLVTMDDIAGPFAAREDAEWFASKLVESFGIA